MTLRTDIQALRGVAVLVVLLYHARLPVAGSGFLGVDVFFVISGYLITGMVRSGIDRGDFSFIGFYARRAKRLLPAAYVTFVATVLAAPTFLNGPELRLFVQQLLGALSFTANIVLWQQTDYFQAASELKPLLHVWSLSLEEQYYFVLPAMLVFVRRTRWLGTAVGVTMLSLALCVAASRVDPVAAFYLLPTRAWELGIGSIGALLPKDHALRAFARRAFWPSLALTAAVPLAPSFGTHPGPMALVVCAATLVVILRAHPFLATWPVSRALARIGDFSYSLYLVHWPLFAFANSAWMGAGPLPLWLRLALMAASLALGFALYRFVEVPTRRAKLVLDWKTLAMALSTTAVVAALAVGFARPSASEFGYANLTRPNYGFDAVCAQKVGYVALPRCQNGEAPRIMVWGDSVAMHLVAGFASESPDVAVVQATRSFCGPLLGIAPVERELRDGYNERWAAACIDFDEAVLDHLAHTPSVEVVVLSSLLTQYFDNSHYRLMERTRDSEQMLDASPDAALHALARTAQAVRALGKRVVLIAPPPVGGFDIGNCLSRQAAGKMSFGASTDCAIDVEAYRRARRELLRLLDRVAAEASIPVIRFDEQLCDARICSTRIGDTFVYRDDRHFSYEGSRIVAARMSLVQRVLSEAR
ncbi:MAG TPA: acyltransferase family protein [Casimicrobiaceae bacterium]|jgi:peptidoglycan/LPS O-acetylase OafA/YrhL